MLIMANKILNNMSPSYMRDHFKISELNNTYLRRGREMKLVLPKPRTEVKKRFSYAGEKIWNDLPENIRSNGNIDGFKRYLKSLLLQWQ